MTIRVLVADDREMGRAGLTTILDTQPDIEVVAEAADGRQAVELARRLLHDVDQPLAVVVITTFDLDEYVYGALKAGARGFLLKDAGRALLFQAVRAAADGDALIAPGITARLLTTFASGESNGRPPQPIAPLTNREEEVLLAVARGRTNHEIGGELYVGLGTVKTNISSLMMKLAARNRVELVIWAYETGRIRP